MLTPTTTTLAFRLAGHATPRAALMTAFARAAPTCHYTTTTTSIKPQGVLASSIALCSFRRASPSSPAPILSQIIRRSQSTASKASRPVAPPAGQTLDWNTFFKLRKTRRRWQLLFSVTMLGVSGTAGAIFLSTGVADPLLSQIPLDPFVTLGIMVLGFAGLGWLAGPSLGSTVFNLINRKWKKQITTKEIEFFGRVKKNRVDPSASGTGNPVPDYYGENISSVAGYRQWLKDQRAFNKKRTNFV
ncbi:hypothetical protein ACHAQA_002291 [Verticillium albo-atrum]